MCDAPGYSDRHHTGNRADAGNDPGELAASQISGKQDGERAFHAPDSNKAMMSWPGLETRAERAMGKVREVCVYELPIAVHSDADRATDAPVTG